MKKITKKQKESDDYMNERKKEEKKEKKVTIGLTLLLILIFGYPIMDIINDDYVKKNTEVSVIGEETQELERFGILECLDDTLLTGTDGGNSKKFAMSLNAENVFVFYTMDDKKMIERKEITFDFKIKEEDRDNAELVLYQKSKNENVCKPINIFSDEECTERIGKRFQYYVLYVPFGTIDGIINLN